EMVVRIAGKHMYLWRAVDHEGEVLEILVQRRRDRSAAVKLMRKLLRKQGFAPTRVTTDSCAPTALPSAISEIVDIRGGPYHSGVSGGRTCALADGTVLYSHPNGSRP